jgi:hypothetical protein
VLSMTRSEAREVGHEMLERVDATNDLAECLHHHPAMFSEPMTAGKIVDICQVRASDIRSVHAGEYGMADAYSGRRKA